MLNLNTATDISDEEIDEVMAYHAWAPEKIAAGVEIRKALGLAIRAIVKNAPPSADRSVAIRKLREARMDANSAITHGGKF